MKTSFVSSGHSLLSVTSSKFTSPTAESKALPLFLIGIGFLLRLAFARFTFLNADEAYHYFLSDQPSLALTYKASLTTAHPPLLLVLLHYWSRIGNSELVLRLPSVLAGTAFCWLMFLWLKRVLDRNVAVIALGLLLFAPSLVWLSAEVRQYALLWFFSAGSLLLFERGVVERSGRLMLLSSLSLCLALLCHYSSFILALVFGVYGLIRFNRAKSPKALIGAWMTGQLACLAVALWLLKTHVLKVKAEGMPQWIADSYLRTSVFQPGVDKAIPFALRANVRFFHYLFARTGVGILGLLLFAFGIFLLAKTRPAKVDSRLPSQPVLALFLVLPFVINCGLALAGVYPYGGSRHNSYLAIFAIPGMAVALARWRISRNWVKPAAIVAVLAFCNFLPKPLGEYIEPRNQNRALMIGAADFLAQSPAPDSVIFTDQQGYEFLNYYLCGSQTFDFEERFPEFLEAHCPGRRLIVRHQFNFKADTFARQFHELQQKYNLDSGMKVWLFQAGWYIGRDSSLRADFANAGCTTPHEYGRNILVCPVVLGPP